MTEKPRYSRAADILDIAIYMQSKPQGVTINEIMERYNISRRTAERMRDSLITIFPQIDEITTQDNQKHWGFKNYSIDTMIRFTPKEIANIEQIQRQTTNKELKSELRQTIEKIKALNKKNSNTAEKEIELYMQTEGYAVRQMPQYKVNLKSLNVIRAGVQFSKMVTGIYHNKKRLIEPLGMIYGEKIYIVAREKEKGTEIYNYLLHKFNNLSLTDKSFDKGNFNLQDYTNLSFGVYHGDVLSVKLSFAKEIAEDVKEYIFHPTQQIIEEKDGSVTVTFHASGSKEIIRNVFKWGKNCKILEPKSLQQEFIMCLEENLANYRLRQ